MFSQRRQQSPTVLVTVVALHVAALAALLYYQPALNSAQANVMHVSMITLPQPLPAVQPTPPTPRKVEITIPIQRAIAPPLEAPSQTAISVASPTPASAESVETEAAAAPQEPPAPLVLPRFDAAYLQNPAPAYPALSRRTGEQGKVLLRVVVRPDGAPETVELRQSSGAARLDEAALEAVRKWRFVPARRGDMPVTAAVFVPVVFTLQGSGA